MGVNKVIYYGEVLVDMSQVTVKPETLAKGETALDASGELITGLHECKETDPKLQSKTVTPTTSLQTVNPDSGYDGLSKVTVNAMPTATQATPSISVSSAGNITATATQTAGYVAAGTKTGTKQLTTQAAQTITPGTTNKTIASGRYLTGTQTIKGDSNLVAGNIKSGVSIFGVAGNYEGSGGGGSGGVDLYPFESYFAGYYTPAANYTTFNWNDLLGIEKIGKPAIFFISASRDLGNSPTFDTKTVIGAIAASTYNGLAILNYNRYGNTTTSYPSFSNSTKASFGSYYLKAGNTYKYCLIW